MTTILICCSSLVRRRCNLALFATVDDSLANSVSTRFIRDSSDVTRDVSRDVRDVTPTSTTSSISCQRQNKPTIHETTSLQDFRYFDSPVSAHKAVGCSGGEVGDASSPQKGFVCMIWTCAFPLICVYIKI